MKAYALTSAEQPASLVDLPAPTAPDGGLLIRARAASVNGIDVYEANGYLLAMMPHDLPTIIGRDVAGVVEAVGAGRVDVAVGDEVIAFIPTIPPLKAGTWAELVAIGPESAVTAKPAGLSFEVGAAIPLAGVTALDAVDAAEVTTGDVVVVIGATGGVGAVAVQLAAGRAATVVATARAGDEDAWIRSLGAAQTIDHTQGDVVAAIRNRFPDGVDVLIDLVDRGEAFLAASTVVRDGGRIATTMGAADVDALAARSIRATNIMGAPTGAKIAGLAAQVADGSLQIAIQATFPLTDAAAAIGAFMAGTRGKIVLVAG